MKITFTEYLQNMHADKYRGTDDDMPEAFDAWLVALPVDIFIQIGQVYGMSQYVEGMKKTRDIFKV